MKKFLVLFTLVSISLPVSAVQMQQSQINQQSGGRIYSSSGSLVEYRETKNNGTTATYNRYHQKTGYYKQQGSKLKYYPKK